MGFIAATSVLTKTKEGREGKWEQGRRKGGGRDRGREGKRGLFRTFLHAL